jgi:uncharacterized protein (TIRG00374 family)
MKRPKPGVLLRAIVSGALLAYVLMRVQWAEARDLVGQTDWFFLVVSVAVGIAMIFVSAWKWYLLLRARGKHLSLIRLFQLYLVGYFFNNVLPTNVGGDVIRGYEAGRELDDKATAMASVFVERFTGLTALVLLAVISFVSNLKLFGDTRFAFALAAAALIYTSVFIIVVDPRPLALLSRLVRNTPLKKLMPKLQKLQEAISSYRNHRGSLYVAMVLSFVFYLLAVLNGFVSTLAFGEFVPLTNFLVIVPVIMVISMIPISLGGIGLQEWGFLFTYTAIGAGGSLGLVVAILIRLKAVFYGIIGGTLHLLKGGGRVTMKELDPNSTPRPATAAAHGTTNPSDSDGGARETMSFHEVSENSSRSPLTKYQILCLGNTKFSQLIQYELLMLLINDLPGLLGLSLRRVFYKRLFRKVGRGVVFGRSLVIRQPAKIEIGDGTLIDDRSILNVRGSARSGISIGRDVFVGRDTTLNTREGTIEIGDSSILSSNVRIGSTSRVILGKHVLVAAFSYIGGASRKFDRLDIPIAHQGSDLRGGVVIEDDVFIANGVIINDGVRIGRGSVVGAGSVVTRDLPAYSIAFGAPAKVVRSRKEPRGDEQHT